MERSQTNCTKQIKWWTTISVLPGMFHKERIGLNNMSTWSRCMLTRISCMSTWFILNVGAEVCYQRNTIMCFFFLLGYIDFLVYAHDLVPAKVCHLIPGVTLGLGRAINYLITGTLPKLPTKLSVYARYKNCANYKTTRNVYSLFLSL